MGLISVLLIGNNNFECENKKRLFIINLLQFLLKIKKVKMAAGTTTSYSFADILTNTLHDIETEKNDSFSLLLKEELRKIREEDKRALSALKDPKRTRNDQTLDPPKVLDNVSELNELITKTAEDEGLTSPYTSPPRTSSSTDIPQRLSTAPPPTPTSTIKRRRVITTKKPTEEQ